MLIWMSDMQETHLLDLSTRGIFWVLENLKSYKILCYPCLGSHESCVLIVERLWEAYYHCFVRILTQKLQNLKKKAVKATFH